jgi:7-cyano-7-deazaguanine synthase
MKHVVVSLSGGMDSSTLLLRCLKEYDTVTAISFDYGQKHRVELERAQSLVDYINDTKIKVTGNLDQIQNDLLKFHGITPEGFGDMIKEVKGKASPINYRQIQLNGLVDLLDSALVTGGDDVPEGHYAEENMKATVVPNRNKIFASIVQAVALSVANKTGEICDIAMGIHAGDHAIYPDCRQEFRDADDHAFRMGNWDAERVGYFTPYLEGDKFTILQDGEVLCGELGLDFNEVYRRTNTSYKPIFHNLAFVNNEDEIVDCSDWFSDYKSASSVERVEAFIKLGRPDPVGYADETGPVSWETARIYVEQVISEHEKEQLNIK